MRIFITAYLISIAVSALAQVEHNFDMSPEKTDCHKLSITTEMTDEAIRTQIENASYRYKERLAISRYKVPHEITFYSCDGNIGWAIALLDNNQFTLFADLPKSVWDALINSEDPISTYKTFEPYRWKR